MDDIKYTLNIGLFDKDTKKQEVTSDKALNIINKILLEYVERCDGLHG